MSSGQVPRRPEYFPLMKWRARKRQRQIVALLGADGSLWRIGGGRGEARRGVRLAAAAQWPAVGAVFWELP
jgi:hypothetical protein